MRVSPTTTLLVPIDVTEVHHRRRRGGLVAALAAAAAVTIVAPTWWNYPGQPEVPRAPTSQAATGTTGNPNPAPSPTPVKAPEQPREATEVATAAPAAPAPPPRPARRAKSLIRPLRSAGPGRRLDPPASISWRPIRRLRPSFSPSSASVGTAMFHHADEAKGAALVRAGTSGDGTLLRITKIVDDTANNFHVRPSPDGSRIAFDSDRDGVRGVYVAETTARTCGGSAVTGFAAVPSWSPDGRRWRSCATSRASRRSGTCGRWSSNRVQMRGSRRTSGQPWGGSWFPDGRRIAYSQRTG